MGAIGGQLIIWRGAYSPETRCFSYETGAQGGIRTHTPDKGNRILSLVQPIQRRAVHALIGNGTDRTYPEAAGIAGMAEGTLLTHINRVRQRHPALYERIRAGPSISASRTPRAGLAERQGP